MFGALSLSIAVFLGSAAVVVWAGSSLAAYADQLAERMRLSRLFVGTLMLAFATSLPEVVTSVTAARANAPDLAVGDLLGASMANMAILAVIDLFYRGKVWPSVELGHARVAAVAMGLTAIATLGILTRPTLSLGWVGLAPAVIAVLYVLSIAWFRRMPFLARPGLNQSRGPIQRPTGWSEWAADLSLGRLWLRFGFSMLLIFGSAPVATLAVEEIAEQTGLDQSFLGAALLAVTTTLPELVASTASLRIGAYDMAVGNLFGSNVANMSVLFVADLAFTQGPILAAVAPAQAISGVGGILLMAIAVASIVGESERTRLSQLEPDAIVLLATYALLLVMVALSG